MSRIRKSRKNEVAILRRKIETLYYNKYFNIWQNLINIGDTLTDEQKYYILLRYWEDGRIACKKLITGDLIFTPFSEYSRNIYNFPVEVNLINERGVSFIPSSLQKVNEDVVLGYAQKNHKPIKSIVAYYVERLAQIDLVINTNLQLHKLPFVVVCDTADKETLEDIIDRILNDEIVVFASAEELSQIKALATNTPYIIDKLVSLKVKYENELLTFFGIDNSGNSEKATTILLDEVNANNEIVNLSQTGLKSCLSEFFKGIDQTFGVKISFALNVNKAEETLESRKRSEAYNKREEEKENEEENQD